MAELRYQSEFLNEFATEAEPAIAETWCRF
jgi:hypothetical protein